MRALGLGKIYQATPFQRTMHVSRHFMDGDSLPGQGPPGHSWPAPLLLHRCLAQGGTLRRIGECCQTLSKGKSKNRVPEVEVSEKRRPFQGEAPIKGNDAQQGAELRPSLGRGFYIGPHIVAKTQQEQRTTTGDGQLEDVLLI